MDIYLSTYLNQCGRNILTRINSMKHMIPKNNEFNLTNIDYVVLDDIYYRGYRSVEDWLNMYQRLHNIYILNNEGELSEVKPVKPILNTENLNKVLNYLPRRTDPIRMTPNQNPTFYPSHHYYSQSRRYTYGGTNYHRTEKTVQFHSRTYRIYTDGTHRYIRYQKKYVQIH